MVLNIDKNENNRILTLTEELKRFETKSINDY